MKREQIRLQKRAEAQWRTQTALLRLMCIVSIGRTLLTRILPLCGSASWWMSIVCLLPGVVLYFASVCLMRRRHVTSLQDLGRTCFGQGGAWLVCLLLTVLLLVDGTASMTALVTFFTQGIGARGTQFMLALVTSGVMLLCLRQEGLSRGVFLLRHMLGACGILAAVNALLDARWDNLLPLLGESTPALWQALSAGWSLAWPLMVLLTCPHPQGMRYGRMAWPVLVSGPVLMLVICLAIPPEIIMLRQGLATHLVLPTLFLHPAVRTLVQCLLMMTLFLSVTGCAQLAARFAMSPMSSGCKAVPYGLILLMTLTQLLDVNQLWQFFEAISSWLLAPLMLLMALLALSGGKERSG